MEQQPQSTKEQYVELNKRIDELEALVAKQRLSRINECCQTMHLISNINDHLEHCVYKTVMDCVGQVDDEDEDDEPEPVKKVPVKKEEDEKKKGKGKK